MDEIILTFQHYRDLRRRWNTITFIEIEPETSHWVLFIIDFPITTKLFRTLKFYGSDDETLSNEPRWYYSPLERRLASSLAVLLRSGRRVVIEEFAIGNEAMSCLFDSLVTLPGRGVRLKLELMNVRFSNNVNSSEIRIVEQCLADGLARNTTFVSFQCDCASVSDSNAAMIVQSLIGHQSLKGIFSWWRRVWRGNNQCYLLSACVENLQTIGHGTFGSIRSI